MAHDLEHLRKHLRIETFPVLFGHSNGACVSLIYAALYPERVDKLIVVAAEINNDTPNKIFARFASAGEDDPVYILALQALMGVIANLPQTDDEFVEALGKLLPYYFTDPGKEVIVADGMENDVVPLRQGMLDRGMPFMHVAAAPGIKAKTLIMAGHDDALCSQQRSVELHEALRDSELIVFECGHFPVAEVPEEFWSAMTGILGVRSDEYRG